MILPIATIALESFDALAGIHAAGKMADDLCHCPLRRIDALEEKGVSLPIAHEHLDSFHGGFAHASQLALKLPQGRFHV
jgi:hypothetical protein